MTDVFCSASGGVAEAQGTGAWAIQVSRVCGCAAAAARLTICREIPDTKEFFAEVKASKMCVVHFYR